jgi:hypothetical protein
MMYFVDRTYNELYALAENNLLSEAERRNTSSGSKTWI